VKKIGSIKLFLYAFPGIRNLGQGHPKESEFCEVIHRPDYGVNTC